MSIRQHILILAQAWTELDPGQTVARQMTRLNPQSGEMQEPLLIRPNQHLDCGIRAGCGTYAGIDSSHAVGDISQRIWSGGAGKFQEDGSGRRISEKLGTF